MEFDESGWNRGIIFFIILTMAKDGPIYGNQVSNFISEKTKGAWRPGAGSVYPALDRLTRRGLLERYEQDGRVMYRITEKGQSLIAKIRERHFERSPISKYMGRIWMDTMGPEERMRFILNSAQHMNESLAEILKGIGEGIANKKEFEAFLINYELELEKALKILGDARKKFSERGS
ncbi:MAG: PadR family transcriptional regulator [Thermoplasmata archaeon]